MFGYDDPDDMVGLDPTNLYADPNAPVEFAQMEEEKSDSRGTEVELQRRDGTTFAALLNRREVLDENGEIQYYDAIVTDITEQKEREEARRARRRKVEALYTAIGHLLRAQEASTVARQVHQLVAEEFGSAFGDVLVVDGEKLVSAGAGGNDGGEARLPDFEVEEENLPAEAYRTGETIAVPNIETAPTGHAYAQLRAIAFVPMGNHGVVAIGSFEKDGVSSFDLRLLEILAAHAAVVLDRIEREQKLIAAKQEAEQASRLKSALLANMSHEIRTPLTAINGFAEVLADEVEGPSADLAERIHRSGERLLQTLTALVHLSKLEAGVTDLDREPVQLGPVVEEAVEILQPKATEKSLQVATQTPKAAIEGLWNEWAVNRIVTNLLENAIKFTPDGGEVNIRVTEAKRGGPSRR
jgi:PAS domain S-box-containing protein